ncbi:TPA: hypothetical protein ACH3X1_014716 [Trebouxia sp. C0004]
MAYIISAAYPLLQMVSEPEEPERDLSTVYDIWNGRALTAPQAEAESNRSTLQWWSAIVCGKEPPFARILWDESKFNHFLVIDMLELWPRHQMMPQKPFVHVDPPLKKRSIAKRSRLPSN